ncbi:MAG: hypothetical protein J5983_06835 [Ruminococcus sp.]|nr:hypothetical protein [Ruminococcus sp.]
MPLGYTRYVEDEYWGYLERTAIQAKRVIENVDEEASREEWKEQIEAIGKEYTCSARFFLMAYLYGKADRVCEEKNCYSFLYNNKEYVFQKVTVEHAQNISDEERDRYLELFISIASDNHGDKKGAWRPVMRKAMLRNKRIELLSRGEGFKIAHGLKFSYEQADQFLISVLDNDGFSFTRSEDIIEAFCFLYPPCNDYYIAERLKEEYRQKTEGIAKADVEIKPENFTKDIAVALPDRIAEWSADEENDTTELFMEWLVNQAPFLDIPGKSAYRLYRNFAVYAWQLIKKSRVSVNDRVNDPYHMTPRENLIVGMGLEADTCESDFAEEIRKQCIETDYELSDEDVYTVASELVRRASLEFDNPKKRKADTTWRYLTVDKNGKITAKAIGDRIPRLLKREESVSKADLLFILWQVCELLWMETSDYTETIVFDRIAGFWYCAEEILDQAMLPRFYGPHLLERSFLNAICAESIEADYPFEIYEGMCEYVLQSLEKSEEQISESQTGKARKSGKGPRKDPEERKEYISFMKKETENMYRQKDGWNEFEGVAELLLEHFKENAAENMQYVFREDGIYFEDSKAVLQDPDAETVISYPDKNTGKRFDMKNDSYKNEEMMKERFQFIYGLELYIKDKLTLKNKNVKFQIHYRKKVSLKIKKFVL